MWINFKWHLLGKITERKQNCDMTYKSLTIIGNKDLIVLGFNNTSTFVGLFVHSPRERKKREETVKEMKEGDRDKRGTGMEGNK